MVLHYSGSLLDWLFENRPEFIEKVKVLVQRGQVEIMTGGYYEPILPLVPDRDCIGQINLLTEAIKRSFNYSPRGAWLTERVWEPHLPKVLSSSGVEYTVVDDSHFRSVGIEPEKELGYYITEEEGKSLFLFSTSHELRYLIPFKPPEETFEFLKSLSKGDDKVIVIVDDGEKFGLWPGTHKWVYEEGWLEKFLSKLEENNSWVNSITFSEFISKYPPVGRVYLPCGSYPEMLEWSGGYFRNYLMKYPESNNMHKKMLSVSERVNSIAMVKSGDRRFELARRHLYRGECNCAYWHGVFGGLYLNHLRSSVYHHLIESENLIDSILHKGSWGEVKIWDMDRDGKEEIEVSTDKLKLYINPHMGGSIYEMDYRPASINLVNTLTRRTEPYHKNIKAPFQSNGNKTKEGILSIHDIVGTKEEGLYEYIRYDTYRKVALLDHFLGEETNLAEFSKCNYRESGDFLQGDYNYSINRTNAQPDEDISIELSRDGFIDIAKGHHRVKVSKTIKMLPDSSSIEIIYRLVNGDVERLSLWFGVEFNLSVYDTAFATRGSKEKLNIIEVNDEWHHLKIVYDFSKETDLMYFPVETVSGSEGGLEKTYQELTLLFNWKIELGKDALWEINFTQEIVG